MLPYIWLTYGSYEFWEQIRSIHRPIFILHKSIESDLSCCDPRRIYVITCGAASPSWAPMAVEMWQLLKPAQGDFSMNFHLIIVLNVPLNLITLAFSNRIWKKHIK